MNLVEALSILEPATSVIANGVAIFDWLKGKVGDGNTPSELVQSLRAIPADSSADKVASLIAPFFEGKGGDAELFAGNNGGGDVYVGHLDLAAGDGPGGGGTARVGGGTGGPDGEGGKLTIVSGKIRGGNAI